MPDATASLTPSAIPQAAENWRPIPGFPGYDVSDLGRVRSWRARGVALPYLMQPKAYDRYVRLNLWRGGVVVHVYLHRLMLAAFEGPCPPGQEVRHLDGDPTNNDLGNLRYGTATENAADRARHGTDKQARCRRGHEFTDETTLTYRGVRRCGICAREYWRQARAAKKAAS